MCRFALSTKACGTTPGQLVETARQRVKTGSPVTEPYAERVAEPTTTALALNVQAPPEGAPTHLAVANAPRGRKSCSDGAASGGREGDRPKGNFQGGAAFPRSPRLGPTPGRRQTPDESPKPKLTDPKGERRPAVGLHHSGAYQGRGGRSPEDEGVRPVRAKVQAQPGSTNGSNQRSPGTIRARINVATRNTGTNPARPGRTTRLIAQPVRAAAIGSKIAHICRICAGLNVISTGARPTVRGSLTRPTVLQGAAEGDVRSGILNRRAVRVGGPASSRGETDGDLGR